MRAHVREKARPAQEQQAGRNAGNNSASYNEHKPERCRDIAAAQRYRAERHGYPAYRDDPLGKHHLVGPGHEARCKQERQEQRRQGDEQTQIHRAAKIGGGHIKVVVIKDGKNPCVVEPCAEDTQW